MNQLIIKDLVKTYKNGVKALDGLNLTIENGMFGLLGPNGAGKSSLMKTLAGLQKNDEGEILFNGNDIVQNPLGIQKYLGYLPQDFGVYPKTSAYDLLNHIAILKGLKDKRQRKEQILALLDRTNLSDKKDNEVYTFSGGMKQRFGVAQVLLGDPKIIIVDEPTAGLDPSERNRFNDLLSEIGEDKIVILSTHLVEDVKNLCTQMAIMFKGRILVSGKPADFISHLKGKIWQKNINKNDREDYEKKYQIISSQLSLGRVNIRIYNNEHPNHNFEAVDPVLEDVYFHLLKSKS